MPVVSLRSAYFPELDVAHSVKPVINRYDEYGVPPAGFSGRFGYAGSMYLNCAMAAPWNMRNRQYNPTLGRFMQTDPIGIAGGVNLYAYVGGDPVNAVDPWGLDKEMITRSQCTDRGGTVVGPPRGMSGSDRCVFLGWIPSVTTALDGVSNWFGSVQQAAGERGCRALRAGGQRFGPGNYRLSANVNAAAGWGFTYDQGSNFTIGRDGSISGDYSERATESYGLDMTAGLQMEHIHSGGGQATFYGPNTGLQYRPGLRLGPGYSATFDNNGRFTGETLAVGLGVSAARRDIDSQSIVHGTYSVCQ